MNVAGLEDGATWEYSTDGGSNWAAETGTSFELIEGTYADASIKVRQTDVAGNVSNEVSFNTSLEIDTVAPSFTSGSTGIPIHEGATEGDVVYKAVAEDVNSTVTYSLSGDDASSFTIDSTSGSVKTINTSASYEDKATYSFDVVAMDVAGNTATQTVTLDVKPLIVDLGLEGNLIAPVTVMIDGVYRTFYHWDRNTSGGAEGDNTIQHQLLDLYFNGGTSSDTTNDVSMRETVINGITLRVPTLGDPDHEEGTSISGVASGTAVSSTMENQTVYDGLLAIWDAHNGSSTNAGTNGMPAGWANAYYHSATSTGFNKHAMFHFGNGQFFDAGDTMESVTVFEVM
jgi:hypothetical protein